MAGEISPGAVCAWVWLAVLCKLAGALQLLALLLGSAPDREAVSQS